MRNFINDLGPNTILAVTETWLKDDDLKTWDVSPQTHKCLSCYRKSTTKSKGGGILLYIPIQLEPKEKPKLNLCNVEHFESIWVELKLQKTSSQVNKVLLNVSYNPEKSLYGLFLDDLSKSIEAAMHKTPNIILMGDYNINYKTQLEKNHLNSLLNQFALNVCCPTIPTRVCDSTETHIDYIITDNVQNSYVFDIPYRTDHYASILITNEKIREKRPFSKMIFDKTNYNKDEFKKTLRSLDWNSIYYQFNGELMLKSFISLITRALKKHAPLKKVYIRNKNPKNILTMNGSITNANVCYRKEHLLSNVISAKQHQLIGKNISN